MTQLGQDEAAKFNIALPPLDDAATAIFVLPPNR